MLNKAQILRDIRAHAHKCGYTLEGLFRAASVSYTNWGRWEKDETSPTISTVNKLLAVPPVGQNSSPAA
jgi:predicted transcriptional regulator